jgi:hypothetical protein
LACAIAPGTNTANKSEEAKARVRHEEAGLFIEAPQCGIRMRSLSSRDPRGRLFFLNLADPTSFGKCKVKAVERYFLPNRGVKMNDIALLQNLAPSW